MCGFVHAVLQGTSLLQVVPGHLACHCGELWMPSGMQHDRLTYSVPTCTQHNAKHRRRRADDDDKPSPCLLVHYLQLQPDAWANAGVVQLQAQRAASAPRVPHPGVPGQVLLPPHGHHEQACLRCHTDALSTQACPGLCILPPPGGLLHLAHYQGILHIIKAFCTPPKHL